MGQRQPRNAALIMELKTLNEMSDTLTADLIASDMTRAQLAAAVSANWALSMMYYQKAEKLAAEIAALRNQRELS